jgi:hypothetical protein
MNGFTRKPWRIGAHGLLWSGSILIAVGSLGFGQAKAAPIHKVHEIVDVDHKSYRTWADYVLGGPSVWSSVAHPPLTAGIEQAIWRNIRTDPSESNPMMQFFMYRENLAPRRFDHYHPRLALELDKIVAAADAQQAKSSPPAPSSVQAQELGPAAQVPEPGILVIALMMTGYALWRRHRA